MTTRNPRSVGYLPPLLKFLQDEPPGRGPGRSHKLVGIYYGRLLIAITEISVKNRRNVSDLSIARKLQQRPEYSQLSVRQLRRDAAAIISDLVDGLTARPPSSRPEELGILPPRNMTKRSLREKAFELLRKSIRN